MKAVNEFVAADNINCDNKTNNVKTSISNVVISRQCNMAADSFTPLCATMIWTSIHDLDKLAKQIDSTNEIIINTLFQLIPNQKPTLSTKLIKVKRKIFNCILLTDKDIELLFSILQSNFSEIIHLSQELLRNKITLTKQIYSDYSNFLIKSRNKISELCSDENFNKGLQLSGKRLFRKNQHYIHCIKNNLPLTKSEKQTEECLISYLQRMVFKPSPFGTFTTINMHLTNKLETCHPQKMVNTCAISRIVLQWLVFQCQQYPALQNNIPLRVNSTYQINSDKVQFLTRPLDGSPYMFQNERFVSLKTTPLLEKIINLLNKHSYTQKTLILKLQTEKLTQENLSAYILTLVKIGFLLEEFYIPDQTVNYCQAFGYILNKHVDPGVQNLANKFFRLHALEQLFKNSATASQRETLIEKIETIIQEIIHLVNAPDPKLIQARSLIYEDMGKLTNNVELVRERFKIYLPNLKKYLSFINLLDDGFVERLSLYCFFKENFRDNEDAIDFLHFYKIFSKNSSQQITQIMSGKQYVLTQKIFDLRNEWHQHLYKLLAAHPEQLTINIADNWLEYFLQKIPSYGFPLQSLLFYLQEISHTETIVINGASMGYGAMMSRFCTIFPDKTHLIKTIFANDLKENFPNVKHTDLCAVLSINTNIHPAITDTYLEYPGCRIDNETCKHVYSLNQIAITADDNKKCLYLVDKLSKKRIHFLPLNFLLPAAGPSLYRFLYLFTPYCNFKKNLWEKFQQTNYEKRSFFPRLQLGNIVIARRMWRIQLQDVPVCKNVYTDPIATFTSIKKFLADYCLPIQGFFHFVPKSFSTEWTDALKIAIKNANQNKSRKPHYIHFLNPFLLKIFFKRIEQETDCDLIFSEQLPLNQESTMIEFNQEYLVQVNNL